MTLALFPLDFRVFKVLIGHIFVALIVINGVSKVLVMYPNMCGTLQLQQAAASHSPGAIKG